MSILALPRDIFTIIALMSEYNALKNLRASCKSFRSMIGSRSLVKAWVQKNHQEHFEFRMNEEGQLFQWSKSSMRWRQAKDLINLMYHHVHARTSEADEYHSTRYCGEMYVFGGFCRDFETKCRDFTDIDVWFSDDDLLKHVLYHLSHAGYEIKLLSENKDKTILYAGKYARHRTYQVTHQSFGEYKSLDGSIVLKNSIILDVTSQCQFTDISRDFDVNCLFIKFPGFNFLEPDQIERHVSYGQRSKRFCDCTIPRVQPLHGGNNPHPLASCYECDIPHILKCCHRMIFNSARDQVFNSPDDIFLRMEKMKKRGFTWNGGRPLIKRDPARTEMENDGIPPLHFVPDDEENFDDGTQIEPELYEERAIPQEPGFLGPFNLD